jgi:hypothetical protein
VSDAIEPFEIRVDDAVLEDLRDRPPRVETRTGITAQASPRS